MTEISDEEVEAAIETLERYYGKWCVGDSGMRKALESAYNVRKNKGLRVEKKGGGTVVTKSLLKKMIWDDNSYSRAVTGNLMSAFVWNATPQGSRYWSLIAQNKESLSYEAQKFLLECNRIYNSQGF